MLKANKSGTHVQVTFIITRKMYDSIKEEGVPFGRSARIFLEKGLQQCKK